MIIQITTDKNLSVHEGFETKLHGLIANELNRFDEHITRLEIHLSDENGNKNGQKYKSCLIEARIEGRQPIAVSERQIIMRLQLMAQLEN